MTSQKHWIVTTDGRGASLYDCKRVPGGRLNLEKLKAIANTHEAEHERHRPTLAGGAERVGSITRSGAHAAPHAIAPRHTADEEQRHFARELGAWLGQAAREAPGQLTVFAPAKFSGLLREHVGDRSVPEIRVAELAHLRPSELADHPQVLTLLGT